MNRLDGLEGPSLRDDLPPFRPGDTLRIHVRVSEGEKERIQMFEGVCIRRRGAGASETFTVRKVSYGVGVERIFPVHGPVVEKIEIKSRGHVRRSRLYYLRDLKGKKARRSRAAGAPEEAVDFRKRERLARGASAWLATHRRPGTRARFDVVACEWSPARGWSVRHFEGAFDAGE